MRLDGVEEEVVPREGVYRMEFLMQHYRVMEDQDLLIKWMGLCRLISLPSTVSFYPGMSCLTAF